MTFLQQLDSQITGEQRLRRNPDMESLTFSAVTSDKQDGVLLYPMKYSRISERTWLRFTEGVHRESHLVSYDTSVLQERWRNGRAAIALDGDEIISYVSLIPIIEHEMLSLLSDHVGVSSCEFTNITLDRSATGWTHPAWRRLGLSFQLRQHLDAFHDRPFHFYLSICRGLGASYVLASLNWQLIGWNEIPFLSSLIGFPALDNASNPSLSQKTVDLIPYQGPHIPIADLSTHSWDEYCHFWISDRTLALALDKHFRACTNSDLKAWRLAIAETLQTMPNPKWRLMLFEQD